eukprot:CAMPEP_0180013834 /NCGR_PEP_ID=MMETSP0984-20121128/17779_1 /TAXON_ID=483367 /ORGANISM="non described non described, Strain CCMP 2436" /LENGTH=103 /DNA_ID=CAMNT_0021936317 /DNA_START=163 /DNA_END=474 /DNA_ORIENTATION=+
MTLHGSPLQSAPVRLALALAAAVPVLREQPHVVRLGGLREPARYAREDADVGGGPELRGDELEQLGAQAVDPARLLALRPRAARLVLATVRARALCGHRANVK